MIRRANKTGLIGTAVMPYQQARFNPVVHPNSDNPGENR